VTNGNSLVGVAVCVGEDVTVGEGDWDAVGVNVGVLVGRGVGVWDNVGLAEGVTEFVIVNWVGCELAGSGGSSKFVSDVQADTNQINIKLSNRPDMNRIRYEYLCQ